MRCQFSPPEHIRSVRQNNSFRESDFRSAEALAYTVGFAHRIGIDERDIQATRMAKFRQCLMQIWEAGGYGAATSTAANG